MEQVHMDLEISLYINPIMIQKLYLVGYMEFHTNVYQIIMLIMDIVSKNVLHILIKMKLMVIVQI